jgi:hypothetical protein
MSADKKSINIYKSKPSSTLEINYQSKIRLDNTDQKKDLYIYLDKNTRIDALSATMKIITACLVLIVCLIDLVVCSSVSIGRFRDDSMVGRFKHESSVSIVIFVSGTCVRTD